MSKRIEDRLGSSDSELSVPVPRNKPSPAKTTEKLELDLNTLFKFIKPYDGSRETVNSFIINCNNAYDLANESQKPILFKYILSQLQGKAELACSIKEFTSWSQLKDFLKTQFCERKHYAHLLTDLQESRQGPAENVNQFALKVETCLSQLLTEISLSDTKLKELPGRIAAMEDLALHHFLMGLNPKISNIVRCRSPKNLNEAVNVAISEERIQSTFLKKVEPRPGSSYRPRPFIKQENKFPEFRPNVGFQKPRTFPLFCRYCKTPGHLLENCRKRDYNNKRFQIPNQNPINIIKSEDEVDLNSLEARVGADRVPNLED